MWQCVKCREVLEDGWEQCWNCGTFREGGEDPTFRRADDAPLVSAQPGDLSLANDPSVYAPAPHENPAALVCPRCDTALNYLGLRCFDRQRSIAEAVLDPFPLIERFDVYCCPRCGRLEFFMEGIGDASRPK